MNKIVSYFTKLLEEIFSEHGQMQPENFEVRKILAVKIIFWLTFPPNLVVFIINLIDKPHELPFAGLKILLSCLPSYYFLKKNNLNYAMFFAYFPVIFLQTVAAYITMSWNLSYINPELALIPYIATSMIFYEKSLRLIGILVNMGLFLFIKIIRFQRFPKTYYEFYIDLLIASFTYFSIIFLAYFYKEDYIKLNIKNSELNFQKVIIETQSEELKTINSTKDRLFSIIAHDLRGPLSSLKGIMYLLDNEYISKEEFNELFARLKQNVDNVHGMLENLLLWSLSQMDGIKPNIKPFDLGFVVDETVILFKEVFTQKNINLISNSSIDCKALGDEYQIRTVLRNILNNAIKFTPENGQILIESKVEQEFINLKISDTGIGVSKEELPSFFSNPTLKAGTAGEKGTGFGLALCKELVEKNGGVISVDSEFGEWTTIEITLPLMMN